MKHKFKCPRCNAQHITTDYHLFFDFQNTCENCKETGYFEEVKT